MIMDAEPDSPVAAHTPGPWVANHKLGVVGDVCDRFRVVIHGDPTPFEELTANLNVISVAPSLMALAVTVDASVRSGEPCPICAYSPHARGCWLVRALERAAGR